MFPSAALLTTLLVLSVTAKPLVISDKMVKLSLERRLNAINARDIVHHDRAHVSYLHTHGQALAATALKRHAEDDHGYTTTVTTSTERSSSTIESNTSAIAFGTSTSGAYGPIATGINKSIGNVINVYLAAIGVGNPPTIYKVVVDTSSANTWIGAQTPYIPTNTSVETGESVNVSYKLGGSWSGKEYLDQVTITSGLVLTNQSIGVADTINNIEGVDGVLGLGPAALTRGTLSPSSNETVPTVTDNAFNLGLIPKNQIGISFQPFNREQIVNGELTWGGVDEQKFTGDLNFVPITTTSPSSLHWGIDQNITYGNSMTILNSTAGIVNSAATFVYLATDAYERYVDATSAKMDNSVGLLTITPSQLYCLKSLFFNINGVSYELTANAQIWPRSLNTAIGGRANSIYLIVADLGKESGSGLDFINGYAFLERFYTVYDTANKQIGFATTPFTNAMSN